MGLGEGMVPARNRAIASALREELGVRLPRRFGTPFSLVCVGGGALLATSRTKPCEQKMIEKKERPIPPGQASSHSRHPPWLPPGPPGRPISGSISAALAVHLSLSV